jgi:hypothetical protein
MNNITAHENRSGQEIRTREQLPGLTNAKMLHADAMKDQVVERVVSFAGKSKAEVPRMMDGL